MSGPLPLRLCCMAAMAPALTEAATQAAKIKLPPETSAAASSDSVSRQNIRQPVRKQGHLGISTDRLTKIVSPFGTVSVTSKPVSHLNGDSHRSVDKQPSVFPTLQRPFAVNSIKVSGNIKGLIRTDKGNLFQNEFLKAIRTADSPASVKVPQIMNKPSPGGLDNEEGKSRGESVQNGSHTPSLTDIGRSAGGNTRGPQHTQAGIAQSLTQVGSAKNMCKKLGEAGRAVPDTTNSSSGPSAGGSQADRQVSKTVAQSLSVVSSSESNVDGDKVDEGVQNARAEAAKKQAQLERRIEFLLRRIRRTQGRQMEVHMRHQLVGYEQYQVQNLQTVAKTVSNPSPSNESSSDLKKELLSDGVKNLSTAALVSLVHRMQASTNSFQQPPQSIKPEVTSVLTMAEDVRRESKVTANKLAMNLNFMQSAVDSDATESSSGGESGDDDSCEGLDLPVPTTPLVRRAEWKWSCERAAVASRWTWLQAQVSDLEYRIRQQSEIYRQARHSKGQVVLGDPPPPQDFLRATSQGIVRAGGDLRAGAVTLAASVALTEVSPCNVSAVLSNVDKQASRLTQSLHCLSPANTSPASSVGSSHPKSRVSSPATAPNGMIDSPLSSASVDVEGTSPPGGSADSRVAIETTDLSPVLDMTCRAARCLPLKHQLRKRKLLRTSGLHLRSAKAAKLSSVKCHCHAPVTPCVLCGGRLNSVQTVDPDSMPYQERVALLDHSYHQVLSFQEEVPLSVHFEALLRSGEWQNKPQVRRTRADQRRQKYAPGLIDGRKKPFRKNAASVIIQSAKIRNKYEQKTGRKPGPQRGKRLTKRALNAELKRRRNPQFVAAGIGVRKRNMKGMMDFLAGNMDSPNGSPLPRETGAGSQKEKEVRKRRGESAYDINNIVIPHSMACLTRVEKLEYKEIPIPSWRVISGETAEEPTLKEEVLKEEVHSHKSNGLITMISTDEEEAEDMTDEAFILRHKVSEAEEKCRFSNFVQYPPTRRNRTQSMLSIQGQESGHHDPTGPATPSNPNLAVSMGTQASLDGADFAGEESMDATFSAPAPCIGAPLPTFSLGPPDEDSCSLHSSGGVHGFSVPRRGSMSTTQRERLSLGSSMDDGEMEGPAVPPWPQRQFPLTEEEMDSLLVEDVTPRESKPQMNLSVVSAINNLRPQPVEGSSQAGSSASGSRPASPMPSSSSTSAVGDFDAADPEWVSEADSSKRIAAQHKAVKR
ncbi:KAT8 regulatory NSL complex subunit 1-like [Littorina saxatilis]|uniref:PEHE domain-containing protein n=1 Tax=Littorina saxatilis TaxID=31220 RepID=A0AAN9ASH9_9CAEN